MEFLFIDEKVNRYRMKMEGNADKNTYILLKNLDYNILYAII